MVALALAIVLSGLISLSLILCLVRMTPCETMLYWSHISALVAYNGGTSVGQGPVRTLFLEPDLVCNVGTLDVGHGPVRTLFLILILFLVPMTAYEAMLYWPHISALVAYNGGTSIGHGPIRTLLLRLFLFLVPTTAYEAMLYWPHISALVAYNGGTSVGHGPIRTYFLKPDCVSSVGKLDVGHGPVTTLFLRLLLCLVPTTPCETMLYWSRIRASLAYNGGTSVGHGPVRTLLLEPDFDSSVGTLDVGHGLFS